MDEGRGTVSKRCPTFAKLVGDDDEPEVCDVIDRDVIGGRFGSGKREIVLEGEELAPVAVLGNTVPRVETMVEPLIGAKPTDGGVAR